MSMRSRKLMVFAVGLLSLTMGSLASLPSWAQPPDVPLGFNERAVEIKRNPEDRPGIWMLDFHFKDPRVITVDIPGRGRRPVWYLWYQVSNNTGAPRPFIPNFVWVYTNPGQESAHADQVLPKAVQEIQKLEDPTGITKILNSQTIADPDKPIPFIRQFDDKGERIAYPRYVTGVATWDDIPRRGTDFVIYVYGLSDGWAVIDGPDGNPIIQRKTLKLKFKRLGDENRQNADQIRYLGHEWIYATMELPKFSAASTDDAPPAKAANPPGRKPITP